MEILDAGRVEAAAGFAAPADVLDAAPDRPVVVDLRSSPAADVSAVAELAAVTIAIGGSSHVPDVVVDDENGAAEVVEAVRRNPIAATALALHLRASATLEVAAAIVAESATYSTLQAGPEHGAWLQTNAHRRGEPRTDDPLRVQLVDGQLEIALARPGARNAVDATMQAALVDALTLGAVADVDRIVVTGDGPVFSAGGDLAEFGTRPDPATAHLVRVARSPGRALHRVAAKTTVVVHGACHGAGVELPAFAGRVIARPDTTFRLPEVAMGLVPGAGGTVSLPRRIGRQRAAWLALTGRAIDAPTALGWGLVDDVSS